MLTQRQQHSQQAPLPLLLIPAHTIHTMKAFLTFFTLFLPSVLWAAIPATPVMTLYRFNSALDIPYYTIDSFQKSGPSVPAGTLSQGTALVPCLVVTHGSPLTDRKGVPYVGFQIVMNPRTVTPAAVEQYKETVKARQSLTEANHHCDAGVSYVTDVRNLYPMGKAPFFDPPLPARTEQAAKRPDRSLGELDQIVRSFHNSSSCANANRQLIDRRGALHKAWNNFIQEQQNRWPTATLHQAKQLDYIMRTVLFEGHLGRGCNAYGSCERNIIALSIRNRGREGCSKRQGCSAPGDFQGVATAVSQYNIWDEYLTQVSGLTSCFLRDDLAAPSSTGASNYRKLQAMYAQNLEAVQRILFGNDQDLLAIFPKNTLADLKRLKHYYHAPAMGKCFPNNNRVEYISGAVATKGNDHALIANARVQVDQQTQGGYFFRQFLVKEEPARDIVTVADNYHGFVIDGRLITLKAGNSNCAPYGIPNGCQFNEIGRYRKTPSWVNTGKPLELQCRAADRGEQCQGEGQVHAATVGGVCDTQMRPFTGID